MAALVFNTTDTRTPYSIPEFKLFDEDNTCMICFEDVSRYTTKLPCNHVLHTDCFLQSKTFKKCPACCADLMSLIKTRSNKYYAELIALKMGTLTNLDFIKHEFEISYDKLVKKKDKIFDNVYSLFDTMSHLDIFDKYKVDILELLCNVFTNHLDQIDEHYIRLYLQITPKMLPELILRKIYAPFAMRQAISLAYSTPNSSNKFVVIDNVLTYLLNCTIIVTMTEAYDMYFETICRNYGPTLFDKFDRNDLLRFTLTNSLETSATYICEKCKFTKDDMQIITHPRRIGLTLLQLAIWAGHDLIVKHIIQLRHDTEYISSINQYGLNAFFQMVVHYKLYMDTLSFDWDDGTKSTIAEQIIAHTHSIMDTQHVLNERFVKDFTQFACYTTEEARILLTKMPQFQSLEVKKYFWENECFRKSISKFNCLKNHFNPELSHNDD
jgi:hypothetical protein